MTKKRIAIISLPYLATILVGVCFWVPGFLCFMALRGVQSVLQWLVGTDVTPESHQLPAYMPNEEPTACWG